MPEVVVHRKRTVSSALMMLLALAIGAGGYLLVALNQTGTFPADWIMSFGPWQFGGPWYAGVAGWFAIGGLAWAVTRWRLPYADPLILPLVFLLNGLGISMIYRLDQADSLHSAELQLFWLVLAILGFSAVVVLLKDHRRLQRFTYVWFLAGVILLLSPLLPVIGKANHGARIWIELGPFSFQPAEIAKIVLSIAFASYLVERRDVLAMAGRRFAGIDFPRPRDLGPILIAWGLAMVVLVFQRDLGTMLLFFGLFVMMLYVATERPSWAILGIGMVVVLGGLGYAFFDHVQTRFSSWLNPFSDYDRNLQVISAQFGFAWGGLFGTGWGMGRPNLTPLAKNDFIAAALGEELGLYGLVAIVVLFALMVSRVLKAALASSEPFGKLLATGLAFVFALQVFVIIGGVTRLLPLTGLTTPFVSQGGSSLVSNYLLVGLMLTITHQVRRPQVELADAGEVISLSADATQAIPAVRDQVIADPRPDPADFGARVPGPVTDAAQQPPDAVTETIDTAGEGTR
ncbi:MAG: FtsW/RodA/SpoVE family cell cycle protein [Propioniciclava sp.]|uniref:FtsW/RodA/SpoVE family cell cycle protein n=1 Tax=Propioniciclava sp. TaxID=2038686 RepID=UPI0039E4128A